MTNPLSLTVTEKIIGNAPLLYEGDFAKGVLYAKTLGYDCVEIHISDPGKLDMEHLKSALSNRNMSVSAIGTGKAYVEEGLSLSSADSHLRLCAVERLKHFIDCAYELNCSVIIGCIRGNVTSSNTLLAAMSFLCQSMQELDIYASSAGVTLLFEPINRYENNFLCSVDEVSSFIRSNLFTSTKLLIDTFHMNIEDRDICRTILENADLIHYAHFADSNRRLPGAGHIDFKKIIATLKEVQYNGIISAECLPLPSKEQAAEQWIYAVKELFNQS